MVHVTVQDVLVIIVVSSDDDGLDSTVLSVGVKRLEQKHTNLVIDAVSCIPGSDGLTARVGVGGLRDV